MIHVQSAVCQHDLQILKWNINLDTFIYPTISLFLLWSNSQLNIMVIYLYIQSRMVTVHAWSDSGQKCVGAKKMQQWLKGKGVKCVLIQYYVLLTIILQNRQLRLKEIAKHFQLCIIAILYSPVVWFLSYTIIHVM